MAGDIPEWIANRDSAFFEISVFSRRRGGRDMKTTLMAVLIATFLNLPAMAQNDNRHRINVSGDATVNVAPDRIIVTFGVDTRDLNLTVAKQQNDVIVKTSLAAIKGLGVADKDIQTDQISIDQRFESNGRGGQVFAGFTVRNMFAVTLTDPSKVEGLISKALDSGVNYLLGVDFQNTELKKFREQARELAVRAAREKAEKMAATLGQKVGSPIQISEDSRYVGSSYYSSWSRGGWGDSRNTGGGASQNVAQVSGGEASDTVALGKVAIHASVSVTFELK
jgi:uncharacterized protein YggE